MSERGGGIGDERRSSSEGFSEWKGESCSLLVLISPESGGVHLGLRLNPLGRLRGAPLPGEVGIPSGTADFTELGAPGPCPSPRHCSDSGPQLGDLGACPPRRAGRSSQTLVPWFSGGPRRQLRSPWLLPRVFPPERRPRRGVRDPPTERGLGFRACEAPTPARAIRSVN